MDTKTIAACVRSDIKAAIKAGALPKGTKVSVRIDCGTLHASIALSVTELPGVVLHNRECVLRQWSDPYAYIEYRIVPINTPEAQAVLKTLQGIVSAYKRDRSDIQSDYFDVNFFDTVRFSSDLESADRRTVLASVLEEVRAHNPDDTRAARDLSKLAA
jgi:hypothetical protein